MVGARRDEIFIRPAITRETFVRHVASNREGFRKQDAR
jgi:hypothetical protein